MKSLRFPWKTRKGEVVISSDEQPRKAMPEKIPNLKPAFRKDGTVTAANSSSISDGAAALVLMRQSEAEKQGLTIRARILGHASHAQEPAWFSTAPVPAMQKLMAKIGWEMDDVDLWEINEAFAVVPMAAEREMGIPREKLNIHGGACALGHPIGASGARIIVTLLECAGNPWTETRHDAAFALAAAKARRWRSNWWTEEIVHYRTMVEWTFVE